MPGSAPPSPGLHSRSCCRRSAPRSAAGCGTHAPACYYRASAPESRSPTGIPAAPGPKIGSALPGATVPGASQSPPAALHRGTCGAGVLLRLALSIAAASGGPLAARGFPPLLVPADCGSRRRRPRAPGTFRSTSAARTIGGSSHRRPRTPGHGSPRGSVLVRGLPPDRWQCRDPSRCST